MDANEVFRTNLLERMRQLGMSEAELSKRASLNPRAVTDIRERRTQSPKLSTVFSLSAALGVDPAEMMGLGPRYKLNADLAAFLEQFEEEAQLRFLAALEALPRQPG